MTGPFQRTPHQFLLTTILHSNLHSQFVHSSLIRSSLPRFFLSSSSLSHICMPGVTHEMYTLLLRLRNLRLSPLTPSRNHQAFASAVILLRISMCELPSSHIAPPRYTKLSLCLSFLPSRCIFSCSLLCPTHITSFFSKLTLGPWV